MTDLDPATALRTEWLLTNGLGGYAMGTALGAPARRYHGLLLAALEPPVRRVLVLHSVIERLRVGAEMIDLATHQFGQEATLHPDGFQRLSAFQCDSPRSVRWTWQGPSWRVDKTLRLAPGSNRATIDYTVETDGDACSLALRPLMPLRSAHDLAHADLDPPAVTADTDGCTLSRDGVAATLRAAGSRFDHVEQWWRAFCYLADRERGQDFLEDVFSPGELVVEPADGGGHLEVRLWAEVTSERGPAADGATRSVEAARESPARRDPHARLAEAAGQFVVQRVDDDDAPHTSIIAGYPWFTDWGRDAMISLPGLLLTTGRLEEAGSLLRTFARHMRRGLIPNCFDDRGGGPIYNTADASLWFVHAVRELARHAGSGAAIDDLIDACRRIIRAYRQGTDFGIGLSADGLLCAGTASSPVTWMDAVRDGEVFSPRDGKAIEINALWHNALHALAELSADQEETDELRELAGHTALSVQMNFWWPERRCCHDVLVRSELDWVGDERLRPNQIFAVSLPFSPLTGEQRRCVVEAVREHLLTPYGLRTLAPDDPAYQGRYEGDMRQRDAAYHHGTVWPWLIGPYGEAVLRVGGFSAEARREVEQAISPLIWSLDRGCIGQVAEIYDGDPPHRASGCPAQAWSVAELLRVIALLEETAS